MMGRSSARPRRSSGVKCGIKRFRSRSHSSAIILDNLAPGNPYYNVPVAVNIRGSLNTTTLARAVEAVAQRHEVLRMMFEVREGSPTQVIHDSLPPEFTVLDLQDWTPERREPAALDRVMQEARRPFSLLRGPMGARCGQAGSGRMMVRRSATHDRGGCLVRRHLPERVSLAL